MSYFRGYKPSLSPAQSIVDSYKFTQQKFKNGETASAIAETALNTAILAGVGIPVSQIRRTIKGAIDLIEGESDDIRRLIYSQSAIFEE